MWADDGESAARGRPGAQGAAQLSEEFLEVGRLALQEPAHMGTGHGSRSP